MKKILKWTGIVLLGLIIVAGLSAFIITSNVAKRMNKVYHVQPAPLVIPSDSASLAKGKQLTLVHCAECHGENLGGTEFFNDPSLAVIPAPNITPGKGGKGSLYQDEDWIRVIRHGVKKDGKPAMIMPSDNFQYMSDTDLGALIAYLKTLPPVDQEWSAPQYTFFSKILMGLGAFGQVLDAEVIDHDARKNITAPTVAPTAEYGAYLVSISSCRTCHGEQLNGFKDPNPQAPLAPNITTGGALGQWSEAQFMQTMRSGVTPDNRTIDSKFMPWKAFAKMSDEELIAIYRYLQAQPKLASAK
ncbi:MAG: c-type cytochrome [Saprospiraceae bacterium]|nr:c-type cytochrome [Saprospiraceae bacterium]